MLEVKFLEMKILKEYQKPNGILDTVMSENNELLYSMSDIIKNDYKSMENKIFMIISPSKQLGSNQRNSLENVKKYV